MTAILVSKPSSKRKKRRIRFHERVQFKTIRHVSEFTDDEITNGWYDKDDFNRMSDNVSEIAQLIADGETMVDGEELCTRGLEHIVEEELADYRAEKMINSIDAVLDEQEEQWDEGKEEPGLIAELYAEYAKPLLKEAHLIGLKDAELGYKTWDELLEQEEYKICTQKPSGSPRTTSSKSISAGQYQSPQPTKNHVSPSSLSSRTKVKNRVKAFDSNSKQYIVPGEKKKVKKSKEKTRTPPKKWNSAASSASESSMSSFDAHSLTPSQSSRSQASSFVLKHQNSVSSINSCTLREDDDLDSFVPSEKLSLSLNSKLSGIDENSGNPAPLKKHKKSNRRTASERKHGSEASPFIYNRHGTLTFRKPDVEKLQREKREKRKNAIRGSLGKFLMEDDDEDDILAGILSGR